MTFECKKKKIKKTKLPHVISIKFYLVQRISLLFQKALDRRKHGCYHTKGMFGQKWLFPQYPSKYLVLSILKMNGEDLLFFFFFFWNTRFLGILNFQVPDYIVLLNIEKKNILNKKNFDIQLPNVPWTFCDWHYNYFSPCNPIWFYDRALICANHKAVYNICTLTDYCPYK